MPQINMHFGSWQWWFEDLEEREITRMCKEWCRAAGVPFAFTHGYDVAEFVGEFGEQNWGWEARYGLRPGERITAMIDADELREIVIAVGKRELARNEQISAAQKCSLCDSAATMAASLGPACADHYDSLSA